MLSPVIGGFRITVKLPLNLAEPVIESFHALHISPRFYVRDDGLVIVSATQKTEN